MQLANFCIFSLIFAVFIPIDSGTIRSSVMPQIGFNTLFVCIFSFIFVDSRKMSIKEKANIYKKVT